MKQNTAKKIQMAKIQVRYFVFVVVAAVVSDNYRRLSPIALWIELPPQLKCVNFVWFWIRSKNF
jgi:hypothetical protein